MDIKEKYYLKLKNMNKYLTKLILAGLVLSGINNAIFGQKCKTSYIRQQNIKKNPEILNEINRINQFTKDWVTNYSKIAKPRAVVTVPIVVHVLWRVSGENINDAQIRSQIDVLNNDFRKLNSNFKNTPTVFQAIAADVELEFCLASTDPSGKATNGITRTQTTVDNIGDTELWYKSATGGKDPWDNTKYINIWVCDLGDEYLGFATPPGTAFPTESDGIVIGSQYFGTTGTATNSAPNNLGKTTTHEMGHYFNLEHVWGPEDGGCNEDDFVDDTPLQEIDSYGCPTFPLLDNCTSTGNGVNFNNYLDYTDDDCMTMFTEGQKKRMLAALNGPRTDLLNSNICSPPLSVTEELSSFESAIKISPNPSIQSLIITISDTYSSQDLHIRLIDLLGREHMNFTMRQSKTIDISSLPQGMYFITFKEYPKAIKKIIITK